MSSRKRLLCIGGSLTNGYTLEGDPLRLARAPYAQVLRDLPQFREWTIDEEGIDGESSRFLPPRIAACFDETSYDIVVVLTGTNDCCRVPPDDLLATIDRSHRKVVELGALPIVVSVPPLGVLRDDGLDLLVRHSSFRDAVNAGLRQSAQASSWPFVDLYGTVGVAVERDGHSFTALHPRFDCGDGLHLSREGYDILGELVAQAVASALAQEHTRQA